MMIMLKIMMNIMMISMMLMMMMMMMMMKRMTMMMMNTKSKMTMKNDDEHECWLRAVRDFGPPPFCSPSRVARSTRRIV